MSISRIGTTAAVIAWAVFTLSVAPATAGEGFNPNNASLSATIEEESTIEMNGPKGFPAPGAANSVHVVPAAAFAGDGFKGADSYTFWFFDGAMFGNDAATTGCIRAQAYLPDGGEVYQFWASVIDNNPGSIVWADFWRVSRLTGVAQKMARAETTSDNSLIQGISDLTIAYPVVDYPTYSYYVTTCLDNSNERLYSMRIWYHSDSIFEDGFGTGNTSRWNLTVN